MHALIRCIFFFRFIFIIMLDVFIIRYFDAIIFRADAISMTLMSSHLPYYFDYYYAFDAVPFFHAHFRSAAAAYIFAIAMPAPRYFFIFITRSA